MQTFEEEMEREYNVQNDVNGEREDIQLQQVMIVSRSMYPDGELSTFQYRDAIRQHNFSMLEESRSFQRTWKSGRRQCRSDPNLPLTLNSFPPNLRVKFNVSPVPSDSTEATSDDNLVFYNRQWLTSKQDIALFDCYENTEPEFDYLHSLSNSHDNVNLHINIINECENKKIERDLMMSYSIVFDVLKVSLDYERFKRNIGSEFNSLTSNVLNINNLIYSNGKESYKIMLQKSETLRVRLGHVVNKFLQIANIKSNSSSNGRYFFQYYIDKMNDVVVTYSEKFQNN